MNPKPQRRNRRWRSRPMAIRQDIRRHNVARLMILGWSTGRIARKLGCTVRTVRDTVATPELGEIFPELQAEHYKHVDRMMGSLLLAALSTLLKMLKHEDWRARYAAIQTIMQDGVQVSLIR